MGAHVVTQNKEQFQDSPLEDSSPITTSTHSSGTGGSSTAGLGQFDPSLVEALAQEIIKFMKGR